jgi:selenocysteine-specific elongation factor
MAERRLILGTAGHIDHGKTELIKAITGIDTDRLQEEKARGISIDLGFAHLDLPGGTRLGIVDVPGHERFIKNMLAGVGGIDIVLFVVACDEGIMPQTREHFDIISLLGVKHAIFALTKSDMVDEEMVELVREDVGEFLRPTRFAGSPIVVTSTKTGRGLDDLVRTLDTVSTSVEETRLSEVVRLPVDRVFTMAGRGTVVTGTLWSGTISREARLEVLPAGLPVRVRSVEVHGREVERAFAGQRTALGLHGVDKSQIGRGDSVVSPGDFGATSMVDVEITLLPAVKPLRNMARVRFHLGASEVMARVHLVDALQIDPGSVGFGQMRLESDIAAAMGDRFVIRSYSPMRTTGGGKVLDPVATKHRRRDRAVIERLGILAGGDIDRIVETYIKASRTGIRLDSLRARVNIGIKELERIARGLQDGAKVLDASGGLLIHAETLHDIETEIESVLEAYQKEWRLTWGMAKEELRTRMGVAEMALLNWILGRLEAQGRIFIKQGMVRAGSGKVEMSPDEAEALSKVRDLLRADLFQPPSERQIEAAVSVPAATLHKVINLLVQDGEVVRLEPGLIMDSQAVEAAKSKVAGYLRAHGEATAGDLKAALGTTRKYAVPLLEHLDRLGFTRRRGDKRILA